MFYSYPNKEYQKAYIDKVKKLSKSDLLYELCVNFFDDNDSYGEYIIPKDEFAHWKVDFLLDYIEKRLAWLILKPIT